MINRKNYNQERCLLRRMRKDMRVQQLLASIESDAGSYEDNQRMVRIPDDKPQELQTRAVLTEKDERTMQNNDRMRKHMRVRQLLASLNTLSEELFAAINVAERQIAVLQDLHGVFLTNYRKKTEDNEKGYPLQQNPFYKNIAPIPILSENSEQIGQNTLETIAEAIRKRKAFIKRVKELVENMDIRRKIVQSPHENK